jgi:hypothetical protein
MVSVTYPRRPKAINVCLVIPAIQITDAVLIGFCLEALGLSNLEKNLLGVRLCYLSRSSKLGYLSVTGPSSLTFCCFVVYQRMKIDHGLRFTYNCAYIWDKDNNMSRV